MLRPEQIQKDLSYHFLFQNIPFTPLLYERLNIVVYRMIQIIWTNIKLNENLRISSTVLKMKILSITMPTALYNVFVCYY